MPWTFHAGFVRAGSSGNVYAGSRAASMVDQSKNRAEFLGCRYVCIVHVLDDMVVLIGSFEEEAVIITPD